MAYQGSKQGTKGTRKQLGKIGTKVLAKYRNITDAELALGNGIVRMPKAALLALASYLGVQAAGPRKWELARALTAWVVRNIWAA